MGRLNKKAYTYFDIIYRNKKECVFILRPYTKEWLEELCAESYSYAEVLSKAGRKKGGGSQ